MDRQVRRGAIYRRPKFDIGLLRRKEKKNIFPADGRAARMWRWLPSRQISLVTK